MARKSKKTEETSAVSTELTTSSGPCVRCNHSAIVHMQGKCEECDCECFVFPPENDPLADPLGNQRLLDDSPERSRAINEIFPCMQSVALAKETFQRATSTLVEAQKVLSAKMHEHNLKRFEYGGLEALIVAGKEKLEVHATGQGTLVE